MHAWLRRALCAVGITGGIVLLGFGLAEAASADGSGPTTTGQSGILSGNQTGADAQAPVNLSGNQITVIGQRNHTTSSSASSTSSGGSGGSSGSPTTSGQNGGGSGNQTGISAQAPVNATGNQVTVIGQDNTTHATGGSSTTSTPPGHPTTSGENGIGSGNQTAIGLQAPINVSGNQVTVIGQDNTVQSAAGTSSGGPGSGTVAGSGSPTTSGESGIGSGNQTGIDVQAPVNASGNQVTVVGQDNTVTSTGGSTTGGGGGSTGAPTTSGENGILSGNQTGIGVQAPIAATGNQITVIGQDNTLTSTGGSSTGGNGGSTGETTTGAGGIGSGNQTPIGVQVPVDSSGNQVTVIGQDNTDTSTSGSTSGGTSGGTPGTGAVVSPPTGGVVSPPAGGPATNVSQGVSGPGTTVLPSTGLSGAILWLALLGLALLGLGTVLTRRGPVLRPALVRAS
jgi:hypothetical protein